MVKYMGVAVDVCHRVGLWLWLWPWLASQKRFFNHPQKRFLNQCLGLFCSCIFFAFLAAFLVDGNWWCVDHRHIPSSRFGRWRLNLTSEIQTKFKRTKQTKWNETNESKRNERRVKTPTRAPPCASLVCFVSFRFYELSFSKRDEAVFQSSKWSWRCYQYVSKRSWKFSPGHRCSHPQV